MDLICKKLEEYEEIIKMLEQIRSFKKESIFENISLSLESLYSQEARDISKKSNNETTQYLRLPQS